MTQQQPLVSAPIFFPFSQLHLFGFRSRQNVWRLTILKRTMTNMTNTQIRPKARLKHRTAAVKSEEVSRFGIRHLF
jgi:hypothetical protein